MPALLLEDLLVPGCRKLQLAAAMHEFTGAVEFTELGLHGPLLKGELDQALALPLDEDGCLPIPPGPGLGVELDEEQITEVTMGRGQ